MHEEAQVTSSQPKKRLLRWIRPYRGVVTLLLLGTVFFFALAQTPPLFIAWLIDRAIPSGSVAAVMYVAFLYFAVLLARHVFSVVMDVTYTKLGARISIDISRELLTRAVNADLKVAGRQRLGDILARIKEDVGVVKGFLSETIVDLLSNVLTLAISLGVLAWFDWRMALAVAVTLPLVPLPFTKMRAAIRTAAMKYRNIAGEYTATLQEMLAAVLPVQIAGAQSWVMREYDKVADRYVRSLIQLRLKQMAAAYGSEVVGNAISTLVVLGFGGYLVIRGELSVGKLIAAQMYAGQLIAPAVSLSRAGVSFQSVLAALARIEGVYDLPQRQRGNRRLRTRADSFALKAEDVGFSYPEKTVLEGVSISCGVGELVAVVGPSGAGKTTLAYILSGLFVPDRGRAVLGDVALVELEERDRWVFMVPQEPFLFHASIRENLLFGLARSVSDDEVWSALEKSQAREFVSALPEGIDTQVGERGATLSGGERQRLVLARALLQRPAFLVLDEVTSALDATTESRLLTELRSWCDQGGGAVLITHRISSALKADRVYVVSEGKVVEEGAPKRLLESGGPFARLYLDQR